MRDLVEEEGDLIAGKRCPRQDHERGLELEGVEASPHRFGGTEFRVGRRELGHIHWDYQADIVFPMEVRDRLVKEGRVEPHHIIPKSGWTTFRFGREEDVAAAVELFRLSYEIAVERLRAAARAT